MKIVAYAIICLFSMTMLVLPATKQVPQHSGRRKLAFWLAGLLGLLWVALGVQQRWPLVNLAPPSSFLLATARTLAGGISIGLSMGIWFFGGFREESIKA